MAVPRHGDVAVLEVACRHVLLFCLLVRPLTLIWSRLTGPTRCSMPTATFRKRGYRLLAWGREVDGGLKAAQDRVVDVATVVAGGQDHQTGVGLDPLQQVGHLLVGVLVVGVANRGALPEQGVGLIEEQNPALVAGRIVLFRSRPSRPAAPSPL